MSVLLIDTCGPVGSVALVEDGRVAGLKCLPERETSSSLLPAVERLMAGRAMRGLEVVGVVHGPGSFTGVRVGMAAAKGLCEGTGARLVAVSRLAVLADTAGFAVGVASPCIAVLDAGRGEFYVRDVDGHERLVGRDVLVVELGMRVAVAEMSVFEALAESGAEMIALDAGCALRCVLEAMELPQVDAGLVDANYVRAESDIYARGGGRKV